MGTARERALRAAESLRIAASWLTACGILLPIPLREPLLAQLSAVDDVDRAILSELSRNARLSNVELADRVKLTPSPCLRRVRALEESGVIRGYHAEIDPAALERGFEVSVLVELTRKDKETVTAFEAGIEEIDAVVECRRMYGEPDYIMRVAVADPDAFEAFLMNQLGGLPGLGRMSSLITMKLVKNVTTL
jgi:DNA-binding Lrp family transcriptional regulator